MIAYECYDGRHGSCGWGALRRCDCSCHPRLPPLSELPVPTAAEMQTARDNLRQLRAEIRARRR
jgi:hypothetical protein